jgi:hypothetical protein
MNENGLLQQIKNRPLGVSQKIWGGCGCLTLLVVILLVCGLTYAAVGKINNLTVGANTGNTGNTGQTDADPGQTDADPGQIDNNPGQTGSNPNMVGGNVLNPCAANPGLQIQPLVENGTVIPNAFMGLDLNRTEVDAGLRYVLDVPTGTYVQYFEAWTGTTWEAVGPTQVTATAWTSWCNNSGWISQNGFPTGQHRQLNANRLPEAIGQWITK